MRQNIKVTMKNGTQLAGVKFTNKKAKTAFIAMTGVGGNIRSNRFYKNIGSLLSENEIDFIVAHGLDAFNRTKAVNQNTKQIEYYGAEYENFSRSDDEVQAYLDYAMNQSYEHIILGGQSLGANKVIHYLATHPDSGIDKFFFLSPVNVDSLRDRISNKERLYLKKQITLGNADEVMPFKLFKWQKGIIQTGWNWLTDNTLNNTHIETNADFKQVHAIKQSGALLIRTHDGYSRGNPERYLKNINNHMLKKDKNTLLFITDASHVYRNKEQEVAEKVLETIKENWKY